MRQFENKWIKNWWLWCALILLIISAAFGIAVAVCNWESTLSKVTAIALSTLATIASFFCGVRAHAKQTSELEEILLLVKGIGKQLTQIGNVNLIESACAVYVKLTLYAMYHAYSNRGRNQVTCKTISEKYPDLILIIVQTIFAAFKSDAIMGWIGDDGCIVVDEFNKNIPKDCTDGKVMLRSYEHMKNYNEIKASINRINRACGMLPIE